MMEVSLCPFAEGTLQTVSCSCLNEKVAGDVHIVQGQCPWKHKGTGQHSTDITSGKKEHTTKQGGTVQFALVFLFRRDKNTGMFSKTKIQKDKTTCSERRDRRCSSFSHCRSRPNLVIVAAPRTPTEFARQQRQQPAPFTREVFQHLRCMIRHRSDRRIVLVGKSGTTLFGFGQNIKCPRKCVS